MLNKYFKMETDLIIYLQKFNTWIICHILCVKLSIYTALIIGFELIWNGSL